MRWLLCTVILLILSLVIMNVDNPVFINKATGLIRGVEYLKSPNQDQRPDLNDINMLVLHSISLPPGQFSGESISELFLNKLDLNSHPYFNLLEGLTVSAHLLIRRDGSIIQYVPFYKRAWHAGKSIFQGREKCNDFSIGIELEGTDDSTFEPIQYENLAYAIKAIMQAYPKITRDRIVGHSDVAPGRKTDPGPKFDWNYLDQLLQELNSI